jgi:hypothetical protein
MMNQFFCHYLFKICEVPCYLTLAKALPLLSAKAKSGEARASAAMLRFAARERDSSGARRGRSPRRRGTSLPKAGEVLKPRIARPETKTTRAASLHGLFFV